jgi:hypothetical protein
MCIPAVSATLEGISGFVAKNVFCFYGLAPIRSELEKVVAKIASRHFGSFAGGIIGQQLGVLLSLPVTLVFAECVSCFVKETIRSVINVTSGFFFYAQPKNVAPLWRDIAVRVASYAIGFFSKAYFCNYAMPLVQTSLQYALTMGAPLLQLPLPCSLLMGAIATIATPSITFILSDFVAWAVEETSYQIMDMACQLFTTEPDAPDDDFLEVEVEL